MSQQSKTAMAPRTPGDPDEAAERRRVLESALLATGMADRTAFRRVYELTSAKLFGICLRICGERQAAEDVLQEVYILVWRRAPGFVPGRGSPITWLAAIARHRAIDWRRANPRSRGEPLSEELTRRLLDVPDDAPAADAAMLGSQEAERLRACFAALAERPRNAIRAAFLDGLTYGELATRDAVPLATMKSIVRRGLLQLRKCLSDDA